jgi:hypothetical protein
VAPGAGFEPARGRINSAVPFQLGYPGKTWSGTWESNPVISAFQAQRISVFLVPELQFLGELVGPSGLEPESQASETCALSRWTMDRSGTGVGNRTRIPGLGNRRSLQLNYARSDWGDRRESNSRGAMHSRTPKPLGHGHTWRQEHESNVLVQLFRLVP